MLHALINFFMNRKGQPEQKDSRLVPQAPYKIEPPAPIKCGCGRSPTGNCVGLHKLSEAEWSAHPDNPAKPAVEVKSNPGTWPFPNAVGSEEKKPAVKAKPARAKKAPVAAMTPAEKPKKAPAKPRSKKPRTT